MRAPTLTKAVCASAMFLIAAIPVAGQGGGAEFGFPTRFGALPNKTAYIVGEPVILNLALYNDSGSPIKGPFGFDFGVNTHISYRKAGGDLVRYSPRWQQEMSRDYTEMRSKVIDANGSTSDEAVVFFNTKVGKLVLETPGDYEIVVRFVITDSEMPGRTYEASVLVRVDEVPAGERPALVALSDPQLRGFLEGDVQPAFSQPSEVAAARAKAEAFLSNHPNSIYAPFVARVMALHDQL